MSRIESPGINVRRALIALVLMLSACTPLLESAPTPVPTATTWVRTGSMLESRWGHSATVLRDGRVLVAGGIQTLPSMSADPTALASVEIFDPVIGTWAPGPPMLQGRRSHTAIRLVDGRVLVFGGFLHVTPSLGEDLDAELFDPTTGTWTSVAPPRLVGRPRALVLADGRVVISGTPPPFYRLEDRVVEVFVPSDDMWTRAATGDGVPGTLESMAPGASVELDPDSTGVDPALAGRLPDGRVLVWKERSARVFDPTDGRWTDVAPPSARPGVQSLSLADGRILILGWWSCAEPAEPTFYDPATDGWSSAGNLPNSYKPSSTVLADGRVLVAGGAPACVDDANPAAPSTEAFILDPAIIR